MRRSMFPIDLKRSVTFLFLLSLAWALPGMAHQPPIDQVGHHIQLVLYADRVLVDYAIVFSEVAYYRTLAQINVDGEGGASNEELDAYHRDTHTRMVQALELKVDDEPVPLVAEQVDDTNPRIFSYLCRAEVESSPGQTHEIQLHNSYPIERGETMEYWLQADYGIRVVGTERWQRDEDAGDTRGMRGVTVRYKVGARPSTAETINPRQTGQKLKGTTSSGKKLRAFMQSKQLSPKLMLVGLLTAMALGALHALTPGHGKTVIAAYLIGSKGRLIDAVLLGIVVTITHSSSVILLGLLALYASRYILPQELFPWLGMGAGMLIMLIGTWLLVRRIQTQISTRQVWSRPPGSAVNELHHGHSHAVPECASLGSILSLGIAGGIIPCPDAMVVLLIAVALNRVVLGLAVIGAFSLGLAIVLVTVGVLMVLAKPIVDRMTGAGRWAARLSIGSALVVILLGFAIAVQSLISGGILVFNL